MLLLNPHLMDSTGEIKMSFKVLVRQAGLDKKALADSLGLQPNTVYAWGESPPKYAMAYLELLIEYNRIRP